MPDTLATRRDSLVVALIRANDISMLTYQRLRRDLDAAHTHAALDRLANKIGRLTHSGEKP